MHTNTATLRWEGRDVVGGGEVLVRALRFSARQLLEQELARPRAARCEPRGAARRHPRRGGEEEDGGLEAMEEAARDPERVVAFRSTGEGQKSTVDQWWSQEVVFRRGAQRSSSKKACAPLVDAIRQSLARGRLTSAIAKALCKSTDGRPVLALLVGGTCPAETVHRQLHPKAPEVEKRAVRYDPMRCPQHGKEDDPNRTYQLGRDCKLSCAVAAPRLRSAVEPVLADLVQAHGGRLFFGRETAATSEPSPPPYHWLVVAEGVPLCHVGAACCMPAIAAPTLVCRLRAALRDAGLVEATASHVKGNLILVRGGPGRPIALHGVVDGESAGREALAWLCCADTKAARYCATASKSSKAGEVRRGAGVSMGASNGLVYGGSGNANRMLYIVNAASRAPRPPEVRPACCASRRDRVFVGMGLSSLACDVNRYRVPQRSDEASCLGVPMWVVFPVARKAEVLDSTLVSPEAARRLEVKALTWRRCPPDEAPRPLYAAPSSSSSNSSTKKLRLAQPSVVASSVAPLSKATRRVSRGYEDEEESDDAARRWDSDEDEYEKDDERSAIASLFPASDALLLETRRCLRGSCETLLRVAQHVPFRDGLKLTLRTQKVTAQREVVPEDVYGLGRPGAGICLASVVARVSQEDLSAVQDAVACFGANSRLRIFQRCVAGRADPESNGGRYDASLVEDLERLAPMSSTAVQRFARDGEPKGLVPRSILLAVVDPAHITAEKCARSNEEPVQQVLCEDAAGRGEGMGTYGRDALEIGDLAGAMDERFGKRARLAHAGPLAIYADLAAASGASVSGIAGDLVEEEGIDALARYTREVGVSSGAARVEVASERLIEGHHGEELVASFSSSAASRERVGRIRGPGAPFVLQALAARGRLLPIGDAGDFQANSPKASSAREALALALLELGRDLRQVRKLLSPSGAWSPRGAVLLLRVEPPLDAETACLVNAVLDYARCCATCYRYRLRWDSAASSTAKMAQLPRQRPGDDARAYGIYTPHLPASLGSCGADDEQNASLDAAIRNHWSPPFLDSLLRAMPTNDLHVDAEDDSVELLLRANTTEPYYVDADFSLRRAEYDVAAATSLPASLADRNALPNPFWATRGAGVQGTIVIPCAIRGEMGGALRIAAYRAGFEARGWKALSDETMERLCPRAALHRGLLADIEDGGVEEGGRGGAALGGWASGGLEACDACGRCSDHGGVQVRKSERYGVIEISAGFHPSGEEGARMAPARLLARAVEELERRADRLLRSLR